jgi:polysaccharide export outer membrane protein
MNRLTTILTVWLVLSACASAQQTGAADPPAALADDGMSSYIIGPGDTIQIFVWRNPELSVTVPVRPDGKVSTPLVEDIVAVGKKPSELARDIETRLAEYIRSPQVNVIVTNAQSSFSKVTVIGQVTTPQTVPYREGMRMMDLLLAVGGLTEFAAGNRAKLIRVEEGGREREIKVRLKDLLTRGRLDQNLELRPGDVLIVPESVF